MNKFTIIGDPDVISGYNINMHMLAIILKEIKNIETINYKNKQKLTKKEKLHYIRFSY